MPIRAAIICFALGFGLPAAAATCGNSASGFSAWKADFASEAKKAGVKQRGLAALADTSYASKTIAADRNQKSFKLSFDEFMRKRGAPTIVKQGRSRKAKNPNFYASLERAYGVPAGVLIAIHGMETGFGRFMGNANVVSAVATLAYDCRRPEFFKPHAIAALMMVDRGMIAPGTRGAMHGELGHTQFLPGNALRYGRDGNGDGRVDLTNLQDAMASTANYLKQRGGWRKGAGYQPGEPNFRAIQSWNAAGVYQKAIAVMAAQIDG